MGDTAVKAVLYTVQKWLTSLVLVMWGDLGGAIRMMLRALHRLHGSPYVTDCRYVFVHDAMYNSKTKTVEFSFTSGANSALAVLPFMSGSVSSGGCLPGARTGVGWTQKIGVQFRKFTNKKKKGIAR